MGITFLLGLDVPYLYCCETFPCPTPTDCFVSSATENSLNFLLLLLRAQHCRAPLPGLGLHFPHRLLHLLQSGEGHRQAVPLLASTQRFSEGPARSADPGSHCPRKNWGPVWPIWELLHEGGANVGLSVFRKLQKLSDKLLCIMDLKHS